MDSRKHIKKPAAEIYLVRHAKAGDREEFAEISGKPDRFRPLTKKGKKEFAKIAKKFSKKPAVKKLLKKEKLAVLYSPYTRTRQSAQILEKALSVKGRSFRALEHGEEIVDLVDFIDKKVRGGAQKKIYALVGHEPELSALYARLCGEVVAPFKKGEIRRLIHGDKDQRFALDWRILPLR